MNHKNECLPNFLVVGAQKAGTTTLFNILNQHHQVFIPVAKELHFFDTPEKFAKGSAYYSSLFAGTGDAKAIGEITPSYLFYPEIPERIFNTLGHEVKIIMLLRNPADRAISHFKMEFSRRNEKRSFPEAILEGIKGMKNGLNNNPNTNYLDRGFYSQQIKNYFKFFSPEKILIIIFEEDFIKQRDETVKRIFNFLGVDEETIQTNITERSACYYRSNRVGHILDNLGEFPVFHERITRFRYFNSHLLPLFKKWNEIPFPNTFAMEKMKSTLLIDLYYNSIKELEGLIGRDLSEWYIKI